MTATRAWLVALAVVAFAFIFLAGCPSDSDDGGGGGGGGPNALLTGKIFELAVDVDDPAAGSVFSMNAFFAQRANPPYAEIVFAQHAAAGTTVVVNDVDLERNLPNGPPTITRNDGGSFITDGFVVGGQVRVAGVISVPADAYNHEYDLRGVTASVLYLEPIPVEDEWPGDLLGQNSVSLTPAGGNPQVQRRTWSEGSGLSTMETLFDATGLYVEDCRVYHEDQFDGALLAVMTRNVADPADLTQDTFTLRFFAWLSGSRSWDTTNVHTVSDQPGTLGGSEYQISVGFNGSYPVVFHVDGTTGSTPGTGDAIRAEYTGASWNTVTLLTADSSQEAVFIGGVFTTSTSGGYFIVRRDLPAGTFSAVAAAYDSTAAAPGWQPEQALYTGEAGFSAPGAVFGLDGNILLVFALPSDMTTIRWRSYDAGAAVWSSEGTLAAPNGNDVLNRTFNVSRSVQDGSPAIVSSIDGAHVFFQEDDAANLPVHGIEYDRTGNSMTLQSLVTGSTDAVIGYLVNPEINGDVIVSIAQDATGGPKLYGLRYRALAGSWAPYDTLSVSGAGLTFPGEVWDMQTLLGTGSGDGLSIAQQNDNGRLRIYVSPYSATADAFSNPADIGSPVSVEDTDGTVVIDGAGNMMFFWIGRDGSNSQVTERMFTGGAWDPVYPIPGTVLYSESTGSQETEALYIAQDRWLSTTSQVFNGTFDQLIFVRYRADDYRRFKLIAYRNP